MSISTNEEVLPRHVDGRAEGCSSSSSATSELIGHGAVRWLADLLASRWLNILRQNERMDGPAAGGGARSRGPDAWRLSNIARSK